MTLTLSNISFHYDFHYILKQINIEFIPGKHYLIAGDNGSGKSTLLRVIAGLLKAQKGDLLDPEERLRSVGYLTHKPPFFPMLTFGQQIQFYQKIYHKKIVDLHPEFFRILDCPIAQLSRGMQQRVALGIILGLKQKIYLLDEAFSGLDQKSEDHYRKYLKTLCGSGALIIEVSHKKIVADRYYQLDRGGLICCD